MARCLVPLPQHLATDAHFCWGVSWSSYFFLLKYFLCFIFLYVFWWAPLRLFGWLHLSERQEKTGGAPICNKNRDIVMVEFALSLEKNSRITGRQDLAEAFGAPTETAEFRV